MQVRLFCVVLMDCFPKFQTRKVLKQFFTKAGILENSEGFPEQLNSSFLPPCIPNLCPCPSLVHKEHFDLDCSKWVDKGKLELLLPSPGGVNPVSGVFLPGQKLWPCKVTERRALVLCMFARGARPMHFCPLNLH